MTEEQIQQAYIEAEKYLEGRNKKWSTKCIVQIGIQMALQGEVLYNENGTVQRID